MSTPSAAEFPLPPALPEGFWQWDKMHCPRTQTPLTEEIFLTGVSRGFSDAMDDFACPVGMHYQVANYYAYSTVLPQDLGDEPFEERLARYKQTMDDVLPRMGDLWANEWLPSIQPGLARARSTDYQALDDGALLAELERMSGEFYERYGSTAGSTSSRFPRASTRTRTTKRSRRRIRPSPTTPSRATPPAPWTQAAASGLCVKRSSRALRSARSSKPGTPPR